MRPSLVLRAASVLLACAVVISPSGAQGQNPYSVVRQPIPGGYQRITDGTVLFSAPASDNVRQVTLPFAMKFYSTTTNIVTVGVNGAIVMGPALSISPSNPEPGPLAPNAFIAPFWDDLHILAGQPGQVLMKIEGVAPQRKITFEWRDVDKIPNQNLPHLNFQICLFEGPAGRIEINYGPQGAMGVVLDATAAMEDEDGLNTISFDPNEQCTNNCSNLRYLTLVDTQVRLLQDAGPDIVALRLNPPEVGFIDTPMPLDLLFRSLHGNAIGPFDWTVVMSSSQDLTGATEVFRMRNQNLGQFEILPRAMDPQVAVVPPSTLAPGEYFVGLVLDPDDRVTEVDESNNRLVSQSPVRIVPGQADLVVTRVEAPFMAAAGDRISVMAEISNVGAVTARADVSIVLSTNAAISAQDVEIGTTNVDLMPGASVQRMLQVDLPSDTNSGEYRIGAVADPTSAVPENDETNNALPASDTTIVDGGTLAVVTGSLPRGRVGSDYLAVMRAVGGDGTYRWSFTSGRLPAGLSLAPNGLIDGTPSRAESQDITFRVESDGGAATMNVTLEVTDPNEPLTVATRVVPSPVTGQEYTFQLRSAGSVTSSVSWSATGVPEGLMLLPDGMLVGTPAQVGTSTMTVVARADGIEATRGVLVSVIRQGNLRIDSVALPTASYSEDYSASLTATGGIEPLTWVIKSGRLPNGIELTPEGELTGTPLQVGRFEFVVDVRDAAPGALAARDSDAFELIVMDVPGFTIATQFIDEGLVDMAYDVRIEISGGTGPFAWNILQGTIPDGLTTEVLPQTGALRIFGTPTDAKSTNLRIEAIDGHGRRATAAFVLRVVVQIDETGSSCECVKTASPRPWWLLALALFVWRRRR